MKKILFLAFCVCSLFAFGLGKSETKDADKKQGIVSVAQPEDDEVRICGEDEGFYLLTVTFGK